MLEDDINILIEDIDNLKDLCSIKYEEICQTRKERSSRVEEHRVLEVQIKEVEAKKEQVQKQTVQLESIIDLNTRQIHNSK